MSASLDIDFREPVGPYGDPYPGVAQTHPPLTLIHLLEMQPVIDHDLVERSSVLYFERGAVVLHRQQSPLSSGFNRHSSPPPRPNGWDIMGQGASTAVCVSTLTRCPEA